MKKILLSVCTLALITTVLAGCSGQNAVDVYQNIEDAAVGSYQVIEDAVVAGYQKVEGAFIDKYLQPQN